MTTEQDEEEEETEERLSADKLRKHADQLVGLLDCAKWTKTQPWQPFMRDLEALAGGMEKLVTAMDKNKNAVKVSRDTQEQARAPEHEEDVRESELKEPSAPGACPKKYDMLRLKLEKLDDYAVVVLDDNIMGVNPLSTSMVKRNTRRAYLKGLAIPEAALFVHIFLNGGPRPSTIHVWKEPFNEAERSMGKRAAATAEAAAHAPTTASRQMMHDFFDQYAATKLPKAVLRSMWDGLSKGSRERDARQEVIDNQVLQWMADEGVTDQATFWDMRSLNGADGHKFDAFWDELGGYLQLEAGAGAHERRAAEAEFVQYASKVISIPQMIRDVTELLHAKPGFEDAPIPSESSVAVQFMPNRPTALRSSRFTMRFRFIRKVQCPHLSRLHTNTAVTAACPLLAVGANTLLAKGARGCGVLSCARSQL